MEIKGIRRSSNAEESARKYFQTTNQIISHFKRDGDKKLVYNLCGEENTLNNLLVASSAVHIYHYLGIRTKSDAEAISQLEHSSEMLENIEKKEIYNEILKLLGDSIKSLNSQFAVIILIKKSLI